MAFGKPKKVGVGKPRSEAERKKVNKRLAKKYGYKEAFSKPVKKKKTVSRRQREHDALAGALSPAELKKLRGGK